MTTWPVASERLALRPATPDDAHDLWRIRSTPGVSDWLTRVPGSEAEETARLAEPDRLARTVVLERDGRAVGDLMLLVHDAYAQAEVADLAVDRQAEIGWVLDPAHRGEGLATEAVRALLGVCFDGLGLHRVTAGCMAANTASWRLMERVGMRREAHTVRSGLHRDGTWQDGYTYALLADEWRASRSL
ncbi:GNAT family N-acetyltransferase [Nocardioides rubriscoriae]|uniref:GNAT family N-acetyltransferase n=1 Tax=Nocardioides rubriscoriae TaxID=642762 RepID=UPI001B885A2F|nr:GNAT family protein [Nocardioides rubriscoriae]